MPRREEVNYFGAGPAPLSTAVLEDAAKALLNYNDIGVGIAEISHRSPEANKILADAKAQLSYLLEIPDDCEILFLHGGGSGEFSAVVYHMVAVWVEKLRLKADEFCRAQGMNEESIGKETFALVHEQVNERLRLDYLVTGSWSQKASQEAARLVGSQHVNIVTDAREHNNGKFGIIPPEETWKFGPKTAANGTGHEGGPIDNTVSFKPDGLGPALCYFCDNETVDGVEFPAFPECFSSKENGEEPLVIADMSSNFLSRKVDARKYAAIFGGAQKNIGTTGITIVIVRKSLLPPAAKLASSDLLRKLNLPVGPVVLDWPTIAKNNSLYNTLPIFDIWVAGQVMKRLADTYGAQRVGGQEKVSNLKAAMIYETLDKHSNVYNVVPDRTVRSRMNICLRVKGGDADAEKTFLAGAEKRLLLGLKGHRSVGGIRISNYNAVSLDGVKKLVSYLNDFAQP